MLDIFEELCDKVLHPDDWLRHPDLVHQVILRRPAIFTTFHYRYLLTLQAYCKKMTISFPAQDYTYHK